MKKLACLLALAACFTSAQAAPVHLDLTSGAFSNAFPNLSNQPDSYVEDGFRIRMDRAGDHMDPGLLGDIGFHNDGQNGGNITWTLDYFGAPFSLADVSIAFAAQAFSVTLTGSNGAVQTIATAGTTAILGMDNVTSVTFDIDQDGRGQVVGMSSANVNTAPAAAVPLPGTLALVGLGMAALGTARRRRA